MSLYATLLATELYFGKEAAKVTCGWSPVNNLLLAEALIAHEAEQKAQAPTVAEEETPTAGKKGLLGCWVDGQLKFQSREHVNVHGYAHGKMAERRNVWVAPVGSFVMV